MPGRVGPESIGCRLGEIAFSATDTVKPGNNQGRDVQHIQPADLQSREAEPHWDPPANVKAMYVVSGAQARVP
jgi:hypothetical protein